MLSPTSQNACDRQSRELLPSVPLPSLFIHHNSPPRAHTDSYLSAALSPPTLSISRPIRSHSVILTSSIFYLNLSVLHISALVHNSSIDQSMQFFFYQFFLPPKWKWKWRLIIYKKSIWLYCISRFFDSVVFFLASEKIKRRKIKHNKTSWGLPTFWISLRRVLRFSQSLVGSYYPYIVHSVCGRLIFCQKQPFLLRSHIAKKQ